MKTILSSIIALLSSAALNALRAQCPEVCDATILTDQASNYTVAEGDTVCVYTHAPASRTSLTFSGNVKIDDKGGALILCPEAGDTIIFEGSFLGTTGGGYAGDAYLVSHGDMLFTGDATSIDRTSVYSYGNLWIEDINADLFTFRDDSQLYNHGDMLVDTALTLDGIFQNMASGDSVHINGKLSINDDAVVTNPEGAYIVADLGGSIAGKLHNYGYMEYNDEFLTSSGSILYNYPSGEIQIYGDLNVASGSDTTWNEGELHIHGDGDFNGNYWNSGGIFVDSLMTINAGGVVNFTGGYFLVTNLRFNSGTVIADAGNCAMFIVRDSSYITSSGFTPSGVIALIDSTDDSGTGLDHEPCGGSSDRTDPDDSCGLYISNSDVVSNCLSSTLPVDFGYFTGRKIEGSISLNWSTLSEQQNSHFEILRSADARLFETIGTVQGSINSTELKAYSYTDFDPLPGVNYYLIRQVDLDGSFGLSRMLSLHNIIYPVLNSYGGYEMIRSEYYLEKDQLIQIVLHNVQGKVVYSDEINAVKGKNQLTTLVKDRGLYLVSLLTESKMITKKVMVR